MNSATTEVLESPKQIKLPDSAVEAKPRETVVIFVSPHEVLVQGEPVALVADILTMEGQQVAGIGEGQTLGRQGLREAGRPYRRGRTRYAVAVGTGGGRLGDCLDDLRTLPSASERLRYLSAQLVPSARYLRAQPDASGRSLGSLYLRRLVRGLKHLGGR